MKTRFSDEQMINILARPKPGFLPEVKRLKSLVEKNACLRKRFAKAMLDNETLQTELRRKY